MNILYEIKEIYPATEADWRDKKMDTVSERLIHFGEQARQACGAIDRPDAVEYTQYAFTPINEYLNAGSVSDAFRRSFAEQPMIHMARCAVRPFLSDLPEEGQ